MIKTIKFILALTLLCCSSRVFSQFTNSRPNNQCGTATGAITFTGPQSIIGWEEGHYSSNGQFVLDVFYGTSSKVFSYSISPTTSKVYRVRVSTVPYSWIGYSPIITAYPQVVAGTLTGNAAYIDSGSGTIRITGNSGGNISFGSNSGLTSMPNGYYSYSLTQTKTFQATVSNLGCSKISNAVTVKIFKKGTISVPATAVIGNRITATIVGYYAEKIYRWEYSTDEGVTWVLVDHPFPSFRHEIVSNTRFRALLDFGTFGQHYTDAVSVTAQEYTVANPRLIFIYGDSVGNYIRENQIIVPGISSAAAVSSLGATEKREAVTFIDGLGRPAQTKLIKATPDQKDIVEVIDYDRLGRAPKQYLPYVNSSNTFNFRSQYLNEQTTFYTSTPDNKVAESGCAYSSTNFEKSPLGKVTSQFKPGNCGVLSSVSYSTNDTNEVRLFKSDGSSTTFYPLNELIKIEFTDEDGKKRQTFTNKSGQTILERIQLGETISGILIPWLETYYINYENGAQRYIISPKGVQALKSGSWSFTQSIRDQYVHQFVYDGRGRLIEKKVPGQAWMYYCFDPLDRLVLAQDGNLRLQNKWIYIKYDRKGRVTVQGLYTSLSNHSRAAIQQTINDFYGPAGAPYFEDHAGTNVTFPTSSTEGLVSHYYDAFGPGSPTYIAQGLPGEGSAGSSLGLLTYSSRKVVGTNKIIASFYKYDEKGRLIQITSNNQFQSQLTDLTTIVYDFEGNVTYKKVSHNVNGSVTTVLNRYVYDHMGRTTHVYQTNNSDAEQLLAQYEYNGLGQLVDKKLHHLSGSNFLQSVDYRYTIQGQLATINNAQLNLNTGNNDEANDYFGMELLYNTTESGLNNTNYYNGQISAIKWKGIGAVSGTEDQKSYKYTYDNSSRLKSSTSQMRTGSAWTKEANGFNENTTYDLNGNIITLQRNQRKHQLSGATASYTSEIIDNLIYSYGATLGDQLIKVEDASNNPAGFSNGTNQATEYFYNTDGSITEDRNKGISSVVYNILGKPSEINFTDGRKIEYVYDVAGTKLTMRTYQDTLQSTTDYIGEFVYENGNLSFFGSPEGRVVKNAANNFEYQYAISDHQGNTRVVFSSANSSKTITATFEGNGADNAPEFQNVVAGNVVTSVAGNHTTSGSKVIRMNQTYRIGPAKSLKVFPGDKVDLEVWEYHEGSSGFGTNSSPLTTLVTMVAGAFGGTSGGGGESGIIFNGVNSAINTFSPPQNQGASQPAAYFNYILFDKDYKVLDMGWKLAPASTFTKQKLSFNTINIKEAGYLFVYLSYENESNNWVFFDDLKITHTKTNVIQYNEYYPFGLQTNSSWTREDSKNDFLYNAGSELNTTTGWYEMFYRSYDPALGRFTGIDPLATMYASMTGYNYASNNPVSKNDPSGASPDCPDGDCSHCISCGGPHPDEIMGGGGYSALFGPENAYYYNDYGSWNSMNYGAPYGYNPYSGQVYSTNGVHSNAPDAHNIMMNQLNGVPNAIATGMASNTPSNAWQTGHWEYSSEINYSTENLNGGVWVGAEVTTRASWVNSTQQGTEDLSRDFFFDNNNAIALGIDIVEPGFGAAWDLVRASPGAYTNGAKILTKVGGAGLVVANLALTGYTIKKEIDSRTFNTHSIVNGAVTVVGVGLTVTGLVISAPVVAIVGAGIGIGYGIAQIAGIDSWIDSKWGF